jgi:cytochrome c-type biogenesis protein CcmH/NrfG
VAVLVAVLVFYAVLIGGKGVALLRVGTATSVALGLALLVLPLLGLLLVWREIEFGRRTARLGAVLAGEGGLPADDLPRRPSGRVDRQAADAAFAELRAEAQAQPDSWRAWYRLALAYDAAGDRGRARQAARHAVVLSRADPSSMRP